MSNATSSRRTPTASCSRSRTCRRRTSGSTAASSSSGANIFDDIDPGEELVDEPFRAADRRAASSSRTGTTGFWEPMDTIKDKQRLDALAEGGSAPWQSLRPDRSPTRLMLGFSLSGGAAAFAGSSPSVLTPTTSRSAAAGRCWPGPSASGRRGDLGRARRRGRAREARRGRAPRPSSAGRPAPMSSYTASATASSRTSAGRSRTCSRT